MALRSPWCDRFESALSRPTVSLPSASLFENHTMAQLSSKASLNCGCSETVYCSPLHIRCGTSSGSRSCRLGRCQIRCLDGFNHLDNNQVKRILHSAFFEPLGTVMVDKNAIGGLKPLLVCTTRIAVGMGGLRNPWQRKLCKSP